MGELGVREGPYPVMGVSTAIQEVRITTPLCFDIYLMVVFTCRLRDITTSNQVLQDHLSKIIIERKAELNGESTANLIERKDVFSLLVRASEEDSKFRLNDDELVSDNVKQ
jgi:hypothetical protein